jgi:hypothetical protein
MLANTIKNAMCHLYDKYSLTFLKNNKSYVVFHYYEYNLSVHYWLLY